MAFYRALPELAGALKEHDPLPDAALLPLVQELGHPDATEVSKDHLTELGRLAEAAAARGAVTLDAMARVREFKQMQQDLGLDDDQVRNLAGVLGLTGQPDATAQALAAKWLQEKFRDEQPVLGEDERPERDENEEPTGRTEDRSPLHGDDGLRALHRVLRVARKATTPNLEPQDLQPFVRYVLDPRPRDVTAADLLAIAAAIPQVERNLRVSMARARAELGRRQVRVKPKHLRRFFLRKADWPDGVDGEQDRTAELNALLTAYRSADWPGAGNRPVREEDLDALVKARREWLPDKRSRRYTSLEEAYADMALELLGDRQVNPTALESIGNLVYRVRNRWTRKPQPSRVVTRADLNREMQRRDWSDRLRDRRDEPDETFSAQVSRLQYVDDISHLDELTGWLNGITPGTDGFITPEQVQTAVRGTGSRSPTTRAWRTWWS